MSARGLLALTIACLGPGVAAARSEDAPKTGSTTGPISYHRSIRPIFQQHCVGCHQPAKAQGGYVLTSHAAVLKPGDSEQPGVVAGMPGKSLVVKQILPRDGEPPAMPKGQSPLSGSQVSL